MPIAKIAEGFFCLSESNLKTGLSHYSYFLKRDGGNLLFHPLKKTSELKKYAALFEEHGGIKLQLLTHDAEASASCEWVQQCYGAGLYFHVADKPHLKQKTKCPISTAFSARHQLDDGIEAIPLSGHTLGFTAYRLVMERVFLFIGDFLVPKRGKWTANVRKLLMPVGSQTSTCSRRWTSTTCCLTSRRVLSGHHSRWRRPSVRTRSTRPSQAL